ncbi:hypothetical protein PsYK624_017050 [Phanerochaete sordida]|uniref:Uncharacterized protein n=1 Tax=Phanerochaete sordida TaxID=48140 RepID=A0A9P3FZT4_9APHY|nr:hypothetical protein PsYK624_017050 [Phanerochaete sordida]
MSAASLFRPLPCQPSPLSSQTSSTDRLYHPSPITSPLALVLPRPLHVPALYRRRLLTSCFPASPHCHVPDPSRRVNPCPSARYHN